MYLSWLRNAENMEFALDVFDQEGYDLSDLLGKRIKAYREAFDLGNLMVDDASRGAMHDAVHAILGRMDKSTITEHHVAVGEMILLRGRYDESHLGSGRNELDGDMFARPKAFPSNEAIHEELKRRRSDLAKYCKTVANVAPAELKETQSLCAELDAFIQSSTNGRVLEHFSTFIGPRNDILISAQNLPLCFVGITAHPSGDILKTNPIPAHDRQKLMQIFKSDRPHKDPVWDFSNDQRGTLPIEELQTMAETKMAAVRQLLSPPKHPPALEYPAPVSLNGE